MRRRPASVDNPLPAELTEPAVWPPCPRFDGGEQPCVCWWSQRQQEWIDSGNEWPGNSLTALLDMLRRFECRQPWNQTVI